MKAVDDVVEPIMMICPYCRHEFDFVSIADNKNMWGVFEEYLIVECPKCADGFKIDMSEDGDE